MQSCIRRNVIYKSSKQIAGPSEMVDNGVDDRQGSAISCLSQVLSFFHTLSSDLWRRVTQTRRDILLDVCPLQFPPQLETMAHINCSKTETYLVPTTRIRALGFVNPLQTRGLLGIWHSVAFKPPSPELYHHACFKHLQPSPSYLVS
jgi:hypothetical protein